MRKFIVSLICCFIPSKRMRHVLRRKAKLAGIVDWSKNHVWLISLDGTRREVRHLEHCEFNFSGVNNNVYLYEPVGKLKLKINVSSNVNITIRPVHLLGASVIIGRAQEGCDKNVNLTIGEGLSTTGPLKIAFTHGGGGDVSIGDDCMFSWDVEIHNGDYHTIMNHETKKVLNHNQSVVVGNHVWVGCGVVFWKGAKVSDNSVVGARSIVTHKFDEANVVIAGVPARMIKAGVNWDRRSPSEYEKSL